MANEIVRFWSNNSNKSLIKECIDRGLKIKNTKEKKDQYLAEKLFVFTGSLKTITRTEAKEKVNKLGGYSTNSISKKTDYLVSGSETGLKFEKAQELNIKILNEEEFLQITDIKIKK